LFAGRLERFVRGGMSTQPLEQIGKEVTLGIPLLVCVLPSDACYEPEPVPLIPTLQTGLCLARYQQNMHQRRPLIYADIQTPRFLCHADLLGSTTIRTRAIWEQGGKR